MANTMTPQGVFGTHPAQGGFSPATEPLAPEPRAPHPSRPPQPNNFAERFVGLAQVHPWMPHQTIATLAGLPASDQAVSQMAVQLRKAYGSVDNAIHYVTHDPLLQKTPSLGLAIRSYLTNTIGPWPLADQDLVHVQKQLQSLGWGRGQQTNGVWDTGWNAAYSQYVSSEKTAELGGGQPGSMPVGGALSLFNALLPKQAATAVAGFVANIPSSVQGDLRNLAGQFGASTHVLFENPLGNFNRPAENRVAAQAENIVQGATGQPQNITARTAISARPLHVQMGAAVQILGDVLATHGLLKAGSNVARAAGEAPLNSLNFDEATRGPGAIAKKIFTPASATGGNPTGLLSRAATTNVPILRMTGPVVDKLASGDGFYYRARTLLASPYAAVPTRVAGQAVGQLGLAGAKVRAIGGAESLAQGQTSALQSSIDHMQTINQFDAALQKRLGFTVLGHHFSPGINTLAWILHPPLSGPGSVSESIGKDVTGANQAIQDALGPSTGYGLHIERGVNMVRNKGGEYMTHSDLVNAAGGEKPFLEFWTNKVFQHAAIHYAEVEWPKLSQGDQADMIGQFHDEMAAKNALATEALTKAAEGDPSILLKASAEMVSNDNPHRGAWGGPNELSKRIAAEIDRTSMSARGWLQTNLGNYSQASRLMREAVVPRQGQLIKDPAAAGTIGMARLDYLHADKATAEADALEKAYRDAVAGMGTPGGFAALDKAGSDIRNYLVENYGIDAHHMPADDTEMIALLKAKAENQATRLFPHRDASPQIKSAFQSLHSLGYAPVMGKGIGFDFYDHPNLDLFDSHLTTAKRIVERLGLSPENVPSHDIGFDFNLRFQRKLLEKVESGKIPLPPGYTANTIVADLRNGDLLPVSPGLASVLQKSPLFDLGTSYRANLSRITEALMKQGKSEPEANRIAAARLSAEVENPLGLMHISEKDLRKVLGRRENPDMAEPSQLSRELQYQHTKDQVVGEDKRVVNPAGPYEAQPLFSNEAIHEVYRSIQEAAAEMPGRLMGLQHLEKVAALKLSYMGKPIPGSAGRVIENLPTRLVSLRNKFRFTLSPEFSARRVVKVNAKIALDGVPATLFPMHELEKMGVYKKAMANLDQILPELKNPSYDEGTQALYANDPWGLYNHRNFEAYAAWHWKQMGQTDSEIRANIVKDFGYGSAAFGEGRSSLERSVNFVFFPFSFDKTLYRNFGAYLLDRTAQRLMVQAGLQAYNNYNKSDPTGDKIFSSAWWQKHGPVAQEALRLNAFAHGVSLGQFGGINAPILNLFIPQSYNADPSGVQTIKGFIPAAREFQQLATELTQQSKIVNQVTIDQLHPAKPGVFFARPVAETDQAQLSDAYAYRRQLKTMAAQYLAPGKSGKYSLANDPEKYGQWAGHKIDSTLINELTSQKYPAFTIDNPSVFFAQQAAAITEYTQKMQNQGQPQIAEWIGAAQKVGKAIYANKISVDQEATDTRIMRNYAVRYAETVPGFMAFYNKQFRWQFGPLEGVSHG